MMAECKELKKLKRDIKKFNVIITHDKNKGTCFYAEYTPSTQKRDYTININKSQIMYLFWNDTVTARGFNNLDIDIFTIQAILHEFYHFLSCKKYFKTHDFKEYCDKTADRNEIEELKADKFALKYYKRYI